MRLGLIEAKESSWAKFMAFSVEMFLLVGLSVPETDCPLTIGLYT